MDRFKSLFGIDEKDVQRHVLLLPYLVPGVLELLGIKKLTRGKVFGSFSIESLTVIETNMSAGFVGDAVLYLSETNAENILFFGSCGIIPPAKNLGIGSLVLPTSAYNFESFTDILHKRFQDPMVGKPDTTLLEEFIKKTNIQAELASCISFGSLSLEEQHLSRFHALNAQVIEMECAALFHAGRHISKRALAILFASDILGEKYFYSALNPLDKKSLTDGVSQAVKAIQKFTAN